jgi:hypothetical protein
MLNGVVDLSLPESDSRQRLASANQARIQLSRVQESLRRLHVLTIRHVNPSKHGMGTGIVGLLAHDLLEFVDPLVRPRRRWLPSAECSRQERQFARGGLQSRSQLQGLLVLGSRAVELPQEHIGSG